MKIFYCLISLFIAMQVQGQIIADPATGQMDITNQLDISLNANAISQNSIVLLKVPVYNLHQLTALPAGSCKFIIRLGSNVIPDPAFIIATAPLSNYFAWTSAIVNGQVVITGDLIIPLPGDFAQIAIFKLKGNALGTSIIESSFLVTNHNTNTPLLDEDPNNNTATLSYTISLPIIPVTFTKILATIKDCKTTVNFTTENEINVDKYEIEMSKDGSNYDKAGELTANKGINYAFIFPVPVNYLTDQMFIRIKSIDKDDKFQYSETKKLTVTCAEKDWKPILFPNPAGSHINNIVIRATGALFNGAYNIALFDMSGKLLSSQNLNVLNAAQFNYPTNSLTNGQYIISIKNKDGTQSALVNFLKL